MAGPNKKPKKPETPPSDDEAMSDESDSGSYQGQEEIQATFEGRNLEGQDFHGIKQLLMQLFLKAQIDAGEIADILIGQTGIGSVLKQGLNDNDDEEDMDLTDETDVFGVTSVLNLTARKENLCIKQLYSLLEELTVKHADEEVQEGIKKILQESNKIGFIINERFVNIPAITSVPMLTTLCDEIDKMKKKNNSYDFEYLILISKTTKPKGEEDDEEEMFTNSEEEVIQRRSDWTFDFSVEQDCDSGSSIRWCPEDKELIPFRRVSVFKANKFRDMVNEIAILVPLNQ